MATRVARGIFCMSDPLLHLLLLVHPNTTMAQKVLLEYIPCDCCLAGALENGHGGRIVYLSCLVSVYTSRRERAATRATEQLSDEWCARAAAAPQADCECTITIKICYFIRGESYWEPRKMLTGERSVRAQLPRSAVAFASIWQSIPFRRSIKEYKRHLFVCMVDSV